MQQRGPWDPNPQQNGYHVWFNATRWGDLGLLMEVSGVHDILLLTLEEEDLNVFVADDENEMGA